MLFYRSRLSGTDLLMKRTSILFLLRTYNDIDHIVPVIWKATNAGWATYFLFVDDDYTNDYRIQFIVRNGAVETKSKLINNSMPSEIFP